MTGPRVAASRDIARCALFCALIAIGAFIKVPIPVCPFTLQFLMTSLAGLLLGPRWGTIAVALYVGLGLLGLPIFAEGGGLGYVLNPSFGYLVGFILGTWITARLAPPEVEASRLRKAGACLAGLMAVYAVGMAYLYFVSNFVIMTPISFGALVLYCFVLAVPGDIALSFAAAELARRLAPVAARSGRPLTAPAPKEAR